MAALVATAIVPRQRHLFLVVVITEIILCLMDWMRWQPWQYQFLLTFLLFFVARNDARQFLNLMALLLSATYIYSALHKFNPTFLGDVWHGFVLKGFHISGNLTRPVYYGGYMLGAVELAIGTGLLLAKNKLPFIWMCLAMHACILVALGPWGINFNAVVWPWNAAMVLLVAIVFKNAPNILTRSFFKPIANRVLIVLVGFLPALNFIGFWDDYLSFALYAGGNEKMMICFDRQNAPEIIKSYKTAPFCGDDELTISITKWSLTELQVPVYPQERVYREIKEQWLKLHPNTSDRFIIYDYPYGRGDVRAVE